MANALSVDTHWNESEVFSDRATGRPSRRLTSSGIFNNTPTFHLGTTFSADSEQLLLTSERDEGTALLLADVATGELRVLDIAPDDDGFAFRSGKAAMVPALNAAVVTCGPQLRLYDCRSAEMRMLIEDVGPVYELSHAMGTPDGQTIYVPRIPRHPGRGKNEDYSTQSAALVAAFGGMPTSILAIEVSSGEVREVYHDPVLGTGHVQPNPVDADLLLMDRSAPPHFAKGSDGGKTTRVWVLRVSTGELTEIRPRDANRFQIHPVWSADGQFIYYHGRCREGGYPVGKTGGWHYIGVARADGEVVWEGRYPWFFYGHVSSDPTRNRIVIDSLTTADLVCALDFTDLVAGMPQVEVLARHGSEVNAAPGQVTHPHCHISPDGRWLSYNRGDAQRADVCVTQLR